MSTADRGILYIVWGNKAEKALQRSMQSVRALYPQIPIHVERVPELGERSLQQKSRMAMLSPFKSTLFLDADAVLLGNVDYAFEKSEQFGLACAICECPWLRRYGNEQGDRIEYNTGVIFFTEKARPVFDAWHSLAPSVPAKSTWTTRKNILMGSNFDDQASFAQAVDSSGFNPFVLPYNYNFRPVFSRSFFLPIKIWHEYDDVPPQIKRYNDACESAQRPVTFLEFEQTASI